MPLYEQMKKEITYARLKAEQRLKLGRKPSTLKLVFNPPIYFLRIFFWNRFFLCGWAGFIHAATGAMYSLMTELIHRQLYQRGALSRLPFNIQGGLGMRRVSTPLMLRSERSLGLEACQRRGSSDRPSRRLRAPRTRSERVAMCGRLDGPDG